MRHFRLPMVLASMLILAFFAGSHVPVTVKQLIFTLSMTIKETLVFILPALIASFLFSGIVNLQKQALRFVLLLVPVICISNFVSTMAAFGVGSGSASWIHNLQAPTGISELMPLWSFKLPKWLSNDMALLTGLVSAVLGAWLKPVPSMRLAAILQRGITMLLSKVFVPLMPVFILGFALKLQHEGLIGLIFKDYGIILLFILAGAFSYITLLYIIGARLQGIYPHTALRNMVPAVMTGFSSASSAMAMPLTIIGTGKNLSYHPHLANAVIPSTVNVHLVGDCFAIPVFALAIHASFFGHLPELHNYLMFAVFFVLNKFAVAAVPGGGIIVMLPVLEKYLGFNAEMMSLITGLYILFDPFVTCANVFGNGAFAMLFERIPLLHRGKAACDPHLAV